MSAGKIIKDLWMVACERHDSSSINIISTCITGPNDDFGKPTRENQILSMDVIEEETSIPKVLQTVLQTFAAGQVDWKSYWGHTEEYYLKAELARSPEEKRCV